MMVVEEEVLSELKNIQSSSDDAMLHPEAVVDYAKNKNTALHSKFEWDDTVAGHNYRIWQARQLVKVYCLIVPGQRKDIIVSAFVSMKSDRYSGGGYRVMATVLSDEEMREQLLFEALEDLESWKRKYAALKELEPIFKAMKGVKLYLESIILKKSQISRKDL